MNKIALLDYWMDAEWWEIPELKYSEIQRAKDLVAFPEHEKENCIRIFLGFHKAQYAISQTRRNIRGLPFSFLVSLLFYWDDFKEGFKTPILSPDHTVINRGALMYKLGVDNPPVATRNDVAGIEEVLKAVCERFFSEHNLKQYKNLPEFVAGLNHKISETLFQHKKMTEGFCLPYGAQGNLLPYVWRWARKTESPEQFGPFFQNDLAMVKKDHSRGACDAYLQQSPVTKPIFVGHTENAQQLSQTWLNAAAIPKGRWPVNPKFGLTYLQYIALQAARSDSPLHAVNGPPGTGKTTLLKDLIADRFVERTEQLIGLLKDHKYNLTQAFAEDKAKPVPMIQQVLDYSMVVASANNKAVENISQVLPQLDKDIQDFFPDLAYFRTLANQYQENRWGLFCAVLGNSTNRRAFCQQKELKQIEADGKTTKRTVPGDLPRLIDYLLCINDPGRIRKLIFAAEQDRKNCQILAAKNKNNMEQKIFGSKENMYRVLHDIHQLDLKSTFIEEWQRHCPEKFNILGDDATEDWEDLSQRLLELQDLEFDMLKKQLQASLDQYALHRREQRKNALSAAISDFDNKQAQLTALINSAVEIENLQREIIIENKETQQLDKIEKTKLEIDALKNKFVDADNQLKLATIKQLQVEKQYQREQETQPLISWWKKLLGIIPEASKIAREHLQQTGFALEQKEQELAKAQAEYQQVATKLQQSEIILQQAIDHYQCCQQALAAKQQRLQQLIDDNHLNENIHLFGQSGWQNTAQEIHQASPWGSDSMNRVRSELFQAALVFNQALIECLSYQCRKYLGQWQQMINARVQKNKNAADMESGDRLALWSWFYLCFPVLSTTCHSAAIQFASISQPESLGYLLVDEAGQALPYMITGLLYRCKHAVLIGDPSQLEPICLIPDDIDEQLALKRNFATSAKEMASYMITSSSAQTVADTASPLQGMIGDNKVGIPLRVHRRCDNPMFAYCNKIAYSDTMVQGKVINASQYPQWINSSWLSVIAEVTLENSKYWNEAEADHALKLIQKLQLLQQDFPELAEHDPLFPIYVITPFRLMAEKLKKIFKQHQLGEDVVQCGTVHTFQGQEAPTLIFCLVCDGKQAKGDGWVNQAPNLLNVAISRAKRRLFVIGNENVWQKHRYTQLLLTTLGIADKVILTASKQVELEESLLNEKN